MKLPVLLLWAFLHITIQNPINYWTLKHNVLVLEVTGEHKGHYPLTCLTEDAASSLAVLCREDKDSGIIWKKNGNNLAHGNIHCVALQESSGEGNYSCHDKDGSLLNHTQVLILEANKKRILQTDSFKCSTPNYNGTFHCSWSWHPIRVGKVALIKVWRPSNSSDLHCTEDSSGHWSCRTSRSDFSCSVDLSGHGFSCTDHQHCPFAEEAHFIHITLYVVYDFHIENYSKNFYLSEIVKPDKVHIRKVKDNTVEWIYPSTWDNPYSYFPLTFQLAQLKDKTACGDIKTRKILTVNCTNDCSCKIKRRTKTVCFRAKDALSNSEWSEWSSEIIKPKKKRNRRRISLI
ncbi:unnamed protein product [Knipowitschia caucasica]